MFLLSAIGHRGAIEEAADLLDEIGGFGAVSWHELERRQFRLEAYCDEQSAAQNGIGALAILCPELDAKYAILEDSDWVRMSLDGLPPVKAGSFRIVGNHDKSNCRTGRIQIVIDAGEAFGTGHHGTTLGCLLGLERLKRRNLRPKKVLDVGTGSAVLAIAAAKLGARVVATEIDPRAEAVARENMKLNKVDKNIRSYVANGIRKPDIRKKSGYDLVFANILMKPLIRLSWDLSGSLENGGLLILSGLLTTQEPAIRRAYSQKGLILIDRFRHDVWSTLTFQKKK
jgi:ribosomal protein L11 methyltransferase